MNGVAHNQAGDLHTPNMAFGLGTPLSISTSESHSNTASAIELPSFPPHLLQSQPFHGSNPLEQQQSYAPSSFVHQDPGYETRHGTHSGPSGRNIANVQDASAFAGYSARSFDGVSAQPPQAVEKCVLVVFHLGLVPVANHL